MKILLSCLLLSVVLFGRANPFEPTDTFSEKKQQLLEQQANEKRLKEQQEQLQKLALQKEQEKKQQIEVKAKEKVVLKEDLKIIKPKVLKKEIPLVESKSKKILKFVSMDLDQNDIKFDVDTKHKFINLLIKPLEKKFVFDFRGKLSFYTKREKFDHPYFKSVTIGTHPKENFFRIVVVVKDDIKAYKEKISTKKGIVSITKI